MHNSVAGFLNSYVLPKSFYLLVDKQMKMNKKISFQELRVLAGAYAYQEAGIAKTI